MSTPATRALPGPTATSADAAVATPPVLAQPFAVLCRELVAAGSTAAVQSAAPSRLELVLPRAQAGAVERIATHLGWRRLRPRSAMSLATMFVAADAPTDRLLQLVLHFDGKRPSPATRPMAGATAPLCAAPANGGVCVAFVGCDGAGKSTVTQRLVDWLAPVFRVERIYLGSGQGTCSWLRWPLLLAHRWLSRSRRAPAATSTGSSVPPQRRFRDRLRPVWALTLALEKRQKLRAVQRARTAGAIVVCDRWPQNEIAGFNDGPLLGAWADHRSAWRRALSRWERQPYDQAAHEPPDLLVKLLVSGDVARARKPDMTTAEIARRTAAVQALRFGASTRVLCLDADAPLSTVVQKVQTGVWELL